MAAGAKAKPDYPVRLAGHGLVSEGIPRFYSRTCAQVQCRDWQREDAESGGEAGDRISGQFDGGHARCSCGAESEHLPSQGARRRWHKDHKRAAAAADSGGEEE